MDEKDKDALARAAFQTLVDVAYILSNVDFQRAVWIFGNHPRHYISSFDETIEMFQENLEWLIQDDLWRRMLTQDQITALRGLYSQVELFDHGKRGLDPRAIVGDPGWAAIVSSAKEALAKLVVNGCHIHPSIA